MPTSKKAPNTAITYPITANGVMKCAGIEREPHRMRKGAPAFLVVPAVKQGMILFRATGGIGINYCAECERKRLGGG